MPIVHRPPSIEIAKQPRGRGFAALLFSRYRLQSRLTGSSLRSAPATLGPCLRARRVQILVDISAAPEIWTSSRNLDLKSKGQSKSRDLRAPLGRQAFRCGARPQREAAPGPMMTNAVARGPARSDLPPAVAKRHSRGASRRARLRATGTRRAKQLGPKTQRGLSPR